LEKNFCKEHGLNDLIERFEQSDKDFVEATNEKK
jgi:hypothetical protein